MRASELFDVHGLATVITGGAGGLGRAYAEAMLDTLERWVPMTHAAFREYRMNAALISATGLAVIRRMIEGEQVDQASSGLSPREWRELIALLRSPRGPAPAR